MRQGFHSSQQHWHLLIRALLIHQHKQSYKMKIPIKIHTDIYYNMERTSTTIEVILKLVEKQMLVNKLMIEALNDEKNLWCRT